MYNADSCLNRLETSKLILKQQVSFFANAQVNEDNILK
jgi:hypothetical protein